MLVALHGNFGEVHGQSVVHFVVLEIFADEQSHEATVWVVVDAASHRVLPLKARTLFRVRVRIVLNCFEDLGAELSPERPQSALLF